ncbi:MAG TPA: phosphatase PAP2 family protein [Chitinophagales bacterium]|nr:phosphatase PAP2 family protein [Chitinophagales bacterium]
MSKLFLALMVLVTMCLIVHAQIPEDSVSLIKIDTLRINDDSLISKQGAAPSSHKPLPGTTAFRGAKLNDNRNCLYNVKPIIDVPLCVIGSIGAPLGFYLINKKPSTDTNVILNLDPQRDIKNSLNRKDIHNYDPKLKDISDFFLYGSFAYGFVLLFDHDIRHDAGKIGLLYLETMSLTGASYSMTAASVDKLRPYAYDTDSLIDQNPNSPTYLQKIPEVPMLIRASTHTRNSFYGGHPSAPAAATLFVASVYSAYHPHSPFRFVLYGVAVAATGTTAYLRYKGGYHFPTDLAVGVALGSAYGLLIPKLHRCKDGSGLTVAPMTGQVKGFDFRYTF